MHLGLGIAAYSSVVDWDTCAYLLFCWEEEIFCGYLLQIREQFLSGSLRYCGGEYSAYILGIYYVVVSVLLNWFSMHLMHTEYLYFFFDFFLSLVPLMLCVMNLFFSQAVCTILAMIATLPLAQLFFFHILLIKKVKLGNRLVLENLLPCFICKNILYNHAYKWQLIHILLSNFSLA